MKKEEKKKEETAAKQQPGESIATESAASQQPTSPPMEELIPTDPTKGKGHWYVVHTYSGHENRVKETLMQRVATMGLQGKIFEVLVPTRNIVQVKHGKKEEMKEKIFPGYILVRMILDDESWLAVRTTQGVTAFVGTGSKPTPISDTEVKAIMKFMALEAPKFKTKFTVNEAVKIIDGPFADFLGSIEHIDEAKGKVRVLVSIFGRETPVELDFLQISKL